MDTIYGKMEYERLSRTKQLFGSSVLNQDLFDLVCGYQIATGSSRSVWTYTMVPDWVLKIEPANNSFQNVKEWETWFDVMNAKRVARWFAPCHWISPNGKILIQERVYDAPQNYKYPKRVPRWFTDLKKRNWGLTSEGNFVCRDYGLTLLSTYGCDEIIYQKAEWNDD